MSQKLTGALEEAAHPRGRGVPGGYVHAATATCGTTIENGFWCPNARSRWPTILYFGLWVSGMKLAISFRK